ncbi:hypothetical protein [Streptomyces sp. NPDC050428]|uniref:hypothetical protein n=1 Tax=Streptomyces sp. NPDC050428 TaxID=3155757 RepID=UPI00343E0E79
MRLTEQAAKFETECTNCRRSCSAWAVQLISEGKLGWELNWCCPGCGIEADDISSGPAPEYIRRRLIEGHGTARIRVGAAGGFSGRVLKAFRDAFGGSIQEARRAATELVTTGWRGTHVEVSLVAQLLHESGIETIDCGEEEHGG